MTFAGPPMQHFRTSTGPFPQGPPAQFYHGPPAQPQPFFHSNDYGYQQAPQTQPGPNGTDRGTKRPNSGMNWKERCLADPWENLEAKPTPGQGDRLILNAPNQRHTVLFAPREEEAAKPSATT